MITKYGFFLLGFILVRLPLMGQSFTQTVRGTVKDKESQAPLSGVSVTIKNAGPSVQNVVTDNTGSFRVEKVAIGSYDIVFSRIGYEQLVLPGVTVSSGKEVVLSPAMTEAVMTLKEIVVASGQKRGAPGNEFATVSGRSFSVAESNKYAGTFDDPARMVTTFAGVQGGGGAGGLENQIVIRGNSPTGMLWRVDGIEVPSPNHFSDRGASNGSISILSSNMLATSDFYSGAFTAESGNALSGVFDIKLRRGNNEKREYALRAGVIGLDASMEGPFKDGGNSSYLVNYRYSTLGLLNNLGVKLIDNMLPVFQDLSFKLYFPAGKSGNITVFGLGGLSKQTQFTKGVLPDGTYGRVDNREFSSDLGVTGINYHYNFNAKTYLETILALSYSRIGFKENVPVSSAQHIDVNNQNFKELTSRATVAVNHKFNARLVMKTGIIYGNLHYDLLSQYYSRSVSGLDDELNAKGNTGVWEGYTTWKYRVASNFSLTGGLHYNLFTFNSTASLEPRAGAKWDINERESLGVGFGVHSKREDLASYLVKVPVNGVMTQLNKDMGFSKARHYVLSYDRYFRDKLHLKAEAYYQDLYNIPVLPGTSYSVLNNTKWVPVFGLKNEGSGKNYGLEITLEKYLSKKYYYIANISLFQSKYKGGDGVERNTVFNTNFLSNVLVGKDFYVGKNKNLNANVRMVYTGGRRYIPIKLEQSNQAGYPVYDLANAYKSNFGNFFRADVQASYTINYAKNTLEFRIEIQNVTNSTSVQEIEYSPFLKTILERKYGQIIPVVSAQVKF